VRGAPSTAARAAAAFQAGRLADAIALIEQGLRASPDDLELLRLLGQAELAAARPEAALPPLQRALAAAPGDVPTALLMGAALIQCRRAGEAQALLELLARLAPKHPEVAYQQGFTALMRGDYRGAANALRRAVELDPRHLRAWNNLGHALLKAGEPEAARAALLRALELDPANAQAWANLTDLDPGGGEGSVAHRRRALAQHPDLPSVRSSLLMCLQYVDDLDRQALFAEHLEWGRRHAPPRPRPPARPLAGRPLRVGFVSGDLRDHAMRYMALPAFQRRPADVHLLLYSTSPRPDPITAEFEAAADTWRPVAHLPEPALAQLIRDDEVDVLVDMSGHAPHHRLLSFAERPAPLQVAWGDYVDTRGMSAIDLLLFDRHHVPPGEEGLYVEQIVRLDPDYICYAPPADPPPVAPGPAAPTFGCFSEPAKVQPRTLGLWARCLRAAPEAHFRFNGRGFAADAAGWMGRLAAQGVDPARISVGAGGPHQEFLRQYAAVSVILDTTPYAGGLTTLEALLMGVPVVALRGDRVCGRHAAAHLHTAGHPELVAGDEDGYVALAVALLRDPPRLAALRAGLRGALLASPLCDAPAFADRLFGALRAAFLRVGAPA
jgi:predicted O-linked N-acetylglucosamine transferase (SPINDLY family)